ncbi:MAG: SRPBCC family protein [Flavobacteriales bacterium]|nr:SRPBCC family protein [Flavobacteriales bacterium]
MKFVKRLLVTLVVFIVLIVLISLFLPSSFRMERSTVINADIKQVFNQVNDLKNWKNWSPWAKRDPAIYIQNDHFSDPSFGKGASFYWKSEHDEVGEGRMEIKASQNNEMVEYVVDFGMGDVYGGFYLTEQEEGVEVNWTMDMEYGFNPIAKFFGLFMEDYVAQDYESGLAALKTYAEDLPKINSVKVEQKRLDKIWFLSIRDTANQMEMTNIHGKLYTEIGTFMDDKGIEMADAPIVIYHFWSDSVIDIEAGIPVKDSIAVEHSRIHLGNIRAGNVVTAIHYGPYERLVETYDGINEWMRKNKVTVIGPPWEQYVTDPVTESNPEKWQTAIFFPIE